jgi:hypothetical protein
MKTKTLDPDGLRVLAECRRDATRLLTAAGLSFGENLREIPVVVSPYHANRCLGYFQ